MATAQSIAMAPASPAQSIAIPKGRGDFHSVATKSGIARGLAMLTPPNSISPTMPAHGAQHPMTSAPLLNIEEEMSLEDGEVAQGSTTPPQEEIPGGLPLSKGALSGLDASAAITPAMLAKDYLPKIMLGNGPTAIRIVIGELNHSVPGFSRIPPAKARRLVVAALESRAGGGPEGNIAFSKTGWGRWDAHVKGSYRDSAVGSFNEGRFSPRSERSSFAMSYNDSALGMSGPPKPYRDHSGESWTNSGSHREEDELDHMDMDVPEEEADKMSLDGDLPTESEADSDSATDDEDWSIPGPVALRKASLPTPGMPRQNYQALSIPMSMRRPSQAWSRRYSGMTERSLHSASVPRHTVDPMNSGQQTPEERAAVEALLQLGSM